MQAQQQQKRQYLRQQILQGGYDQQEFVQFLRLSSKDSEAQIDISLWTFQQLKNLVEQYKALHSNKLKKKKSSNILAETKTPKIKKITSKQQQQKQEKIKKQNQKINQSIVQKPEQQNQRQKIQLKSEQSLNKNKKQSQTQTHYKRAQLMQEQQNANSTIYHSVDQNKQQIFSQTINCQMIPPNSILTAKNVHIMINSYEKKEGGVFEKSYVVYFVETPFFNVKAQRRYTDFQWLKSTLQIMYPGIPVPPIAKKGQFRRYDDKHLKKRMMLLQKFLNKILQVPQLRGSQIFENFLKFDNFIQFQKFKSDYRKLQALPFKQIKNTKGKLSLAIDPKINRFLRKSQHYFNESQSDVKSIFKQFKGAATMLQAATVHLNSISQICKMSDLRDKKFRQQTQTKYFSTNMFTVIQQLSQKYGELLLKQAQTFRKQIYSAIKYEYLSELNYLDAIDKLALLQTNYKQTKSSLQKKKQRLYQEGNTSKWGNAQLSSKQKFPKKQTLVKMLPKQTSDLQKLRQNYALHNFYLYEQLQRYFQRNNMHLADHFQKLAQLHSKINGQSMMLWVDFLTKVSAMKQGKSIQHSDLIMTK